MAWVNDQSGDIMTKTKIAMASLIALSLAACAKTDAAKPAADTAKIADAVKADADQLVADLNAKNLDKAVAHDAPKIMGMFHGQANVTSPAEDKAATKGATDDPAFHLAVADESVDVAQAGDMAIYHATYTATQTDPKTRKVGNETGNWVAVYKPQPDGSWKIAMNMIADTAPAAAAPAAPAAPAKK